MSQQWLKKPPENVSQSDLRRVQQEKAARQRPVTDDSPISDASPSTQDSPIISESSSAIASPVKTAPVALPRESPSTSVSPVTREQPKRRSRAEYRAGDSRIGHDFFDNELCPLPPLSQLLWLHLNRYRERGSELTIVLSWRKLAERFGDEGVSESTLRRAFAPLARVGLAFKDRTVFGKGGEQGIVFRLFTPDSPVTGESPSARASNKRTDLKTNSQKGFTPSNPETRRMTAAEVATAISDLLDAGYQSTDLRRQFGSDMTDDEWSEVERALAARAGKSGA